MWSTRRGVMQAPQRISIPGPWNPSMTRRPCRRAVLRGTVVVALVLGLTRAALLTTVADAAPGGLVADVVVAEWPNAVSPSVAFDGRYLYHTNYGGAARPPGAVPPPGGGATAP